MAGSRQPCHLQRPLYLVIVVTTPGPTLLMSPDPLTLSEAPVQHVHFRAAQSFPASDRGLPPCPGGGFHGAVESRQVQTDCAVSSSTSGAHPSALRGWLNLDIVRTLLFIVSSWPGRGSVHPGFLASVGGGRHGPEPQASVLSTLAMSSFPGPIISTRESSAQTPLNCLPRRDL